MPRGHVRWFTKTVATGSWSATTRGRACLSMSSSITRSERGRHASIEATVSNSRSSPPTEVTRRPTSVGWSRDDDGDEAAHSTVAAAWQGTKPRRSR